MKLINVDKTTTRVELNDKILGFVRKGGGSHPAWKKANREGLVYHAIPSGFAITLSQIHYATLEEAANALVVCGHEGVDRRGVK